jgi:hypothetical protein
MHTRRFFLRMATSGLIAAATGVTIKAQQGSQRLYVPMLLTPPVTTETTEPGEGAETATATSSPTEAATASPTETATPSPTATLPPAENDAPIVGAPSGHGDQAIAWLVARSNSYTAYDIEQIVYRYAALGESVGLDWFLAIAQCCHETGGLTSWWCQRPRRNPAGIGVSGRVMAGTVENPPGHDWAWDGTQWREGVSFATWADHGIPAHLGRLLAYALRDEQANQAQRDLINMALAVRSLPDRLRGIAPTIVGLNGRWAYPGTHYGQSIVDLARRMRG